MVKSPLQLLVISSKAGGFSANHRRFIHNINMSKLHKSAILKPQNIINQWSCQRFNSNQTPSNYAGSSNNKPIPKFNNNGERQFTEDESQEVLFHLKKIWSNTSLSKREKYEEITRLFDSFQMGGLVSPCAQSMIRAILTDQSPDAEVAGVKYQNMHLFHESLQNYHNGKQLKANGLPDTTCLDDETAGSGKPGSESSTSGPNNVVVALVTLIIVGFVYNSMKSKTKKDEKQD
ncbi:unnamed protein product [Ambrosiozyma monospora]|uniref:Unnamed protein product n=1 Tax=Ambrosiozyma monospora TaxID=43982 RepID=A0A9W7DK12_AMBMO|nr:unnamed protein product [Ambrosiozyma monospora]